MPLLTWSIAEIPYTIPQSIHRCCCHNPASDTLSWILLYNTILYRKHRSIHQIRHCCSAKWYTINVFSPIIPDLVLLCLYCHFPWHTAYLLPLLSSVILIILHLFCCPFNLASHTHFYFLCINLPAYPSPYLLPSLSAIPVISHF